MRRTFCIILCLLLCALLCACDDALPIDTPSVSAASFAIETPAPEDSDAKAVGRMFTDRENNIVVYLSHPDWTNYKDEDGIQYLFNEARPDDRAMISFTSYPDEGDPQDFIAALWAYIEESYGPYMNAPAQTDTFTAGTKSGYEIHSTRYLYSMTLEDETTLHCIYSPFAMEGRVYSVIVSYADDYADEALGVLEEFLAMAAPLPVNK